MEKKIQVDNGIYGTLTIEPFEDGEVRLTNEFGEDCEAQIMLTKADVQRLSALFPTDKDKECERLRALVTECEEYLSDNHTQGGKSAIAVNTISTDSELHRKMKEHLNTLKQLNG